MFLIFFYDALQNLSENKKNATVFIIFLIISFTGITVTDSLIYSVSQKAEMELKISGDNIASVDFRNPVSIQRISDIFSSEKYEISAAKKTAFTIGESPFSEDYQTVLGVDTKRVESWQVMLNSKFLDDVVIISEGKSEKKTFIDGVPFLTVGIKKNKSTDFLESLGLSGMNASFDYAIPLETMFRLTLSTDVDNIEFVKSEKINASDIKLIDERLKENGIKNYQIYSFLDAKETVDKVMNRFGILTNSIYVMLTIMAVIVVYTVCRRNFELRSTEFAIKVIHGVNRDMIILVVIMETFIVTLFSAVVSIIISYIAMFFLSLILDSGIKFRFYMICLSLTIVVLSCYLSGTFSGLSFFNKEPLKLIKERML